MSISLIASEELFIGSVVIKVTLCPRRANSFHIGLKGAWWLNDGVDIITNISDP